MTVNRREFLLRSGSALLGSWALGVGGLPAHADPNPATDSPPTLVALYMRGGADPLGVIAPYADPLYAKLRPTIALAAPGEEDGCLPLAPGFGLHPSMKALHQLYQQGLFAPILNVGSPHPTRSHFDAQDFMEFAAPGVRTITEGWLNRYLSATNEGKSKEVELRALAAQPLLPRALRGQFPVLAVPDMGAVGAMDAFQELYQCPDGASGEMGGARPADDKSAVILAAGRNTIRKLQFLKGILAQAENAPVRYPNGPLGTQFRAIAQVIKSGCGLEVAAVDYNGWDHHAKEGAADGAIAGMLAGVSDTLAAFAADLGPERMKKVLVLTMSEFGRTVQENGTGGSDHGHGGFMLALGGAVKGGKVYGKWTGLEPASLYEQRDMPVHTDFRIVFAEVLRSFLGFKKLEGFFPDYRPQSAMLGFLKNA